MNFIICGDTWVIKVLEDDKFESKYGEMLSGVTTIPKKTVDISRNGFSLETITHELCHCYWYYTCSSSSSLTEDQIEETWCELFSTFGEQIIKLSKKLHKILKKDL